MRLGRFRRRPASGRPPPASAVRTVEEEAAPPVATEDEYVPPPPPPVLWPWLLLLLLLVVGGLAAAYFLTRDNDNNKKTVTAVTVPGVVGLKQDAAVQRLNERDLTPRLFSRPSKFPRGTVFAQRPAAGAEVARRSPVSLSISAAAVTSVPDVVGTKTAVAVKRLRAVDLNAQVTNVPAATPPGTVIAESPIAGTSVAKGSTVSLRISKGRSRVPDVTGQQLSTAKAALRAAGLVSAVFRVPSAATKGTVVAQKPAAGTKVARGSKVRLNVSSGSQAPAPTTGTGTTKPRLVTVPSVVGLQQSAAQRRLHAAGLGARVLYVTSTTPSGRVVSQKPAAGSGAPSGSKVTIRISLGPRAATTKTVPNVVNQDQQSATQTLQAAGFKVQVIQVTTGDPSQNGIVIDEEPAGGSRAPAGSQVTIYVGQSGTG